ncbi:MAG: hypothetical protein HY273_00410 [Gammaproteobacteria bacterium]|nr:hypothetical protein [Gammaproteobacteria bacterium]
MACLFYPGFRRNGITALNDRLPITDLDFSGAQVQQAVLERVTLEKKGDFTDAKIDTLTVKGLIKSPGLNLILTGSNVKLD